MKFSEAFSTLLKISEIKSKELSKHIGYDVSYISKWSNGKLLPAVKGHEDLFFLMADLFAREIWIERKEEQLLQLMDRNQSLETESQIKQFIYGVLLNAYVSEKTTEEKYPENTFLFINEQNSMSIIDSIVQTLFPKKPLRLTFYISVDFQQVLEKFLMNIYNNYIRDGIQINMNILIHKEEVHLLHNNDSLHFFTLLEKMTFFNVDYYETDSKNYCNYIYLDRGEMGDAVILLNKSVSGDFYALTYSSDERVTQEYRWRNEILYKKDNRLMISVREVNFEYNSLLSCLYPDNHLTMYITFIEAVFMSGTLFDRLMRRHPIPESDKIMLNKIRKLYDKIMSDNSISFIIPKDVLTRKVLSKEIVLWKYTFKLNDSEWKMYVQNLKAKCLQNNKIDFGLIQDSLLPTSMGDMDVFILLNNDRSWVKKDPQFLEEFTKPYLNIIDLRIIRSVNKVVEAFKNTPVLEKITPDELYQYINNIELLEESWEDE